MVRDLNIVFNNAVGHVSDPFQRMIINSTDENMNSKKIQTYLVIFRNQYVLCFVRYKS